MALICQFKYLNGHSGQITGVRRFFGGCGDWQKVGVLCVSGRLASVPASIYSFSVDGYKEGIWYYSDYDPRCTLLATDNLGVIGRDSARYYPLAGKWDLLTPPADSVCVAPMVDVIFGCLPQVPTEEMDLSVGDRIAHYYNPLIYPKSQLHSIGLGMNEALLAQAREVLTPGGAVVLNLGGRPGLSRLVAMFQTNGYQPRMVHEEIIPQHRETSLTSLVALEAMGQSDFEFFVDAKGVIPINARQAEDRRVNGSSVFHKIYVIEGILA